MNIKSVDFIVSAKHYGGSARGYIRKQQQAKHKAGVPVTIRGLDDAPVGQPVQARVWQGQWIADCDICRGASFIDPEEPVFFCFGCGNRANGGYPRPVTVPENWREIEATLLQRPVNDMAGITDLERAALARPVIEVEVQTPEGPRNLPLVRSWEPHETVEDLQAQQDEPIRQWRKELKHGV